MEQNQDYIIRATAANSQIRIFAIRSTNLVEEARERHNTSPVATAALGRLLTAGAMMGSMMKNDNDVLTLQVVCDGPIGGITVTADAKANVKGYVHNPSVMLPPKNGKLDVGGAIGLGTLQVTKDMGLKEPYAGQVELQTGEIAEDLTYYFAISEQTPSTVGLGVLMNKNNTVNVAGGFIIQVLPYIEADILDKLEERIGKLTRVTKILETHETPEEMIKAILHGMEIEILDQIKTRFYCNCDEDRIEKALISIGTTELDTLINEGETIEVKCHFCNTAYHFDVNKLVKLRSILQ